MKAIFKQELDYRSGEKFMVSFPNGYDIISCGFQGERLVVWFTTDTDINNTLPAKFYLIRTGEELPNDIDSYKFIGTANDGDPVFPFVIHVFLERPM